MLGCLPSVTETLIVVAAGTPIVIGEYSSAPELSPIGKVVVPPPGNGLIKLPPPVAIIIREDENDPLNQGKTVPSVQLLPARFRLPFVSVRVPDSTILPAIEAKPEL